MKKNFPLMGAERITGLLITKDAEGFYVAVGEYAKYEIRAPSDKRAAEIIVERNWKDVCDRRARAQDWRCSDCHLIRPLQGHHKVFRSHGRRDVDSNVDMKCAECHSKEHPGPQWSKARLPV